MLEISNLTLSFQGINALEDVSMRVEAGTIHGVIGPNGAGKTTLLNCITRFYQPKAGTMSFEGRNLLRLPAHKLASLGIRRTFQDLKIHPELTVMQNLLAAQHDLAKYNDLFTLLRTRGALNRERDLIVNARNTLRFIRRVRETYEPSQKESGYTNVTGRTGFADLIDLEDFPASVLPFGPRKTLDLARAIVTKPRLLLLDEPSSGTPERDIPELADLIKRIQVELGATIILVEHNMRLVKAVCDSVTVLNYGKKIAEGGTTAVLSDAKVEEAYLGTGTNRAVNAPDLAPVPTIETEPMLELNRVEVKYGSVQAIANVSMQIMRNSITCILGANGAGKSTLLKAIAGMEHISEGTITYEGQVVADRAVKLRPYQAVAKGVVYVLEGRQLFGELSVKDNLKIGGLQKPKNIGANLERVLEYFPALRKKLKQNAGGLSGGEQQMVAIGQALMGEPRLLLLDEPSLGLAPIIVDSLFEIIVNINRHEGVTIVLVEQNAKKALSISHRGYLLEAGRIVGTGTRQELLSSESVQKAFLGAS